MIFCSTQLAERAERPSESWEDIYSKVRKASKMKFGDDERDDEELEKVGQYVSIYEIYSGAGAWPFLHHGALYRAVSLVSFSNLLPTFSRQLLESISFECLPCICNIFLAYLIFLAGLELLRSINSFSHVHL